jgi:uncharacterized protein YkuJ
MLIRVLSTDFLAEMRRELTVRSLEREREELEGEVVRGFKFYRETEIFRLRNFPDSAHSFPGGTFERR